jgi:hypothetical protein
MRMTLALLTIHHTPMISFGWTTILFDAVSLLDYIFQLTDFAMVSKYLLIGTQSLWSGPTFELFGFVPTMTSLEERGLWSTIHITGAMI